MQSNAASVLAATGRLDVRTFLFCNVGDDSEDPATLEYVERVAKPYAAANGIELIELQKTRFGQPETLYGRLTRPGSRYLTSGVEDQAAARLGRPGPRRRPPDANDRCQRNTEPGPVSNRSHGRRSRYR